MLAALKFVQGAIAKKDIVPELMHFRIANGRVNSYNGMIALSCPIALNLDVMPRASQFVRAIQTCNDTISMHVTPAKKLAVKSGSFKCFVECIEGTYPEVLPEGEIIPLNGKFLAALRTLVNFIADDASRPWARGILFKGQSAYATNNVVILEYWLGSNFPVEVNIPKAAVVELVRIGEEPTSIQLTENNVTFHFPENKWLRTQTYSTDWPDIGKILNRVSDQKPLPDGLWEAVDSLSPFTDEMGRLFFTGGKITTVPAEEVGASVDLPESSVVGCYNHKYLSLLNGLALTADFQVSPCLFMGDIIRGAIIGMRT